MTWWDGPMTGFDVETTSASPEDARIVSVALVRIGPAREAVERTVDRWTTIVNPGVEIPQEAIDVHGISNEQAQAEGVELAEAMHPVLDVADESLRAGIPWVAHNARYDFTVTDRELRRLGSPRIAALLARLRVVDPIVIDRHLDKYRPKEPKDWRTMPAGDHSLATCCRVRNVPLEGVTHDATFDAIAAARLAWRLGKNGRVIRRTRDEEERREFIELTQEWERVRGNLDALHEWQARIAWAEAERLEAYFRAGDERKGVPPQPDRVCAREWPVIPPITAVSSGV
jgi:DNA polymerase-3 subunit epsilon